MTLDDYQKEARKTAVYPQHSEAVALYYAALSLAGEAGEVAGEVSKMIRDDNCGITPERWIKLRDEAGDVLWHLSALCDVLGTSLEAVAQRNVEKLADRAERGVVHGSGGER